MKLYYFLWVTMMEKYVLNHQLIINFKEYKKERESLKEVFHYFQFLNCMTRTKILKCEKIHY